MRRKEELERTSSTIWIESSSAPAVSRLMLITIWNENPINSLSDPIFSNKGKKSTNAHNISGWMNCQMVQSIVHTILFLFICLPSSSDAVLLIPISLSYHYWVTDPQEIYEYSAFTLSPFHSIRWNDYMIIILLLGTHESKSAFHSFDSPFFPHFLFDSFLYLLFRSNSDISLKWLPSGDDQKRVGDRVFL